MVFYEFISSEHVRHQVHVLTIDHGISILFVKYENLPSWIIARSSHHQKEIFLCVDQFIEGVEYLFPQIPLNLSVFQAHIRTSGFSATFPPFGPHRLSFLALSKLHNQLIAIRHQDDRDFKEFCNIFGKVNVDNVNNHQYFDCTTWTELMKSLTSVVGPKGIAHYLSVDDKDFALFQQCNYAHYYT